VFYDDQQYRYQIDNQFETIVIDVITLASIYDCVSSSSKQRTAVLYRVSRNLESDCYNKKVFKKLSKKVIYIFILSNNLWKNKSLNVSNYGLHLDRRRLNVKECVYYRNGQLTIDV